MRSQYYFRKLLDVDDDDDGDDSPRNTRSGSTYAASQLPPPPSSSTAANPPFNPTLGFDSSMALTILVLLTALFFMVFFSMYLRRFAEDNSFNISRRRRLQRRPSSSSSSSSANVDAAAARFDVSSSFSLSNGLDPSTIRSLPLYSYDGNTTKEEPILCSVCLSEFEEKETTKVIPYCGHAFHPQCIDKWFSSHSSCPLCRSTQLFREGSGSAAVNKEKETEMMMMMKKDCLVVEVNVLSSQKRCCSEHNHRIVISGCESLRKSTVESGDTSIAVDGKERKEAPSVALRRISSWSGLNEKVLLKRSSSF